MSDHLSDASREIRGPAFESLSTGRRSAQPGEVVESIPFLARAAQMIGVIVPVDAGGMVGCKRIDGIIKILSHVDLPKWGLNQDQIPYL